MIQPIEMKTELQLKLAHVVMSTTTRASAILCASRSDDLHRVKSLIAECAELAYAQCNYASPIHFADRERYADMVNY